MAKSILEQEFTRILLGKSVNSLECKEAWGEVKNYYDSPTRKYHTLRHLDFMFAQLLLVKRDICDWSVVIMALVYHDVIYDATSKLNEEYSAEFAAERLRRFHFSESEIIECSRLILATKKHQLSSFSDDNYLIDADLSILGSDEKNYKIYAEGVRFEYSMYSDVLYNEGRRLVLDHFLSLKSIYKTEYFKSKFELKARTNLSLELG